MNDEPTKSLEPEPGTAKAVDVEARRFARKLAGLFLVITAVLTLMGYMYLTRQQADARGAAHRELAAIADLKLRQISNWREERLADARFVSRARFAAQDMRRFLDDPNSEAARSAVLKWLDLLKTENRYSGVTVFDMRFERRLAIPASAGELEASDRSSIDKVLQIRDIVFSDLHRDESSGVIHLDILFPIFEGADLRQGAPIAIVLLRLDAREFLFPVVQSWPTPSQTAETLLVRREGDSVLYLNDLRHRAGAALALRLPLSSPDLTAARVLRGETRVLEGVDYRGVPVVAAGRLIPGTNWAMVAKMDREEIYAPLQRQMLAVLSVLGALLVAGASLVALLWHQRSAQFLERELALEKGHVARHKAHEQEIDRLNRLYAALSRVNQVILRAGSRGQLEREVCRVLVQFGGFQMAWIGRVEESTSQVIPVEQYGDRASYLQAIRVFADERPEGRGPTGTAIREGHPCVFNDCLAEPRFSPWRDAAARSGWRSLAGFPIREEGRVRGALTVYSQQKDFFGGKEQVLIEEAANDISFGLDVLLNEQRRRAAEESLRQARDELARANANLERKVVERTAQLVEANTNLQTFAYTAAHDLRSPLRSISSFSGIVLEEYGAQLGANGQSLLERVTGAANQMNQLLNDLLDYSKMSQAELKLEPVSLRKAVNEALALLNGDIRGKNAVVTVTEPLPEVIGHAATVVLLINNLVSNALKFMPPGVQPQIRISAERSRSCVRLSVQDNGIGIAGEDLQKIFGPFQRLHGKQAYPGTGLGLAIVRKGAERMGGRVGVESELGKGSRFWIELRLVDN